MRALKIYHDIENVPINYGIHIQKYSDIDRIVCVKGISKTEIQRTK